MKIAIKPSNHTVTDGGLVAQSNECSAEQYNVEGNLAERVPKTRRSR